MPNPFQPVELSHGPAWPNRLMLAPMTNCQSHADGTLSDAEFRWLTKRAEGGFGLVMTCASHVQASGQGFPGQLGCFGDQHLPGLARLAARIKESGAVSSIQLHHAGIRSPRDLIGQDPVGPSEDAETGARELSTGEVERVVEDFASAAQRAESAGFDGAEIHGAHGYIVAAFLSPTYNRRSDRYGERDQLLEDIISAIRARCRPNFQLGIRLSPERYGIVTQECLTLTGTLLQDSRLDYVDISMWDYKKLPEDASMAGRMVDLFGQLPRTGVRLTGAGSVRTGEDVRACLDAGFDAVSIGKAAILHHDWPQLLQENPHFEPTPLPVTPSYLAKEFLGEAMIAYMARFSGFLQDENVGLSLE